MIYIEPKNIFDNQNFNLKEPSKDPIYVSDKFKVMRISLKNWMRSIKLGQNVGLIIEKSIQLRKLRITLKIIKVKIGMR